MAYNSSLNGQDFKEVCGIFICPLKTKVSGPAPLAKDDEEDIISEVLRYYRPNVMFKNYSVKGPADVLLIYLTVFTQYCIQALSKKTYEKESDARIELNKLAREATPKPKDIKFLGGYLKESDQGSIDLFQSYLKQAREELANRLLARLYENGTQCFDAKFWLGLNKRKFMNMDFK